MGISFLKSDLPYAKRKQGNFLLVLFLLQIIMYILAFLDVPIARQVVGFLYLTFVPGFVIIKLLKFEALSRLETVLFSAGFSIAILIFGGLFINEFGFLLGISQPLSLMPLIVILNSLILIGGILVYLRSEGIKLLETKTLAVSPVTALLGVLPILTVIGVMWVNAYENNLFLLLVLIIISLVFVIGTISHKLPAGFLPIAIFVIAISLLLHSSLISRYLVSFGSDNPIEYFVFKTTENNAYWSSTALEYGRFNSMLSVTILPTIYSILLNVDVTNVFKILYPLIFAFVPLVLYQLWQTIFGKKRAFVAAFLLMAQLTFYIEMLGLMRQIVAELFFVLLLFTLTRRMKTFNKMICLTVFSFALITSHYSLAVIFLLFISCAWIFSLIAEKRTSENLSLASVVLFSVVMFLWYVFTSGSASFNSIAQFSSYVYSQLGQFFNLTSRETEVLIGLGLGGSPSIWNTISRVFAYITQFLIVVGFIGLIRRRKNGQFKKEYIAFTVIAMVSLVALIAVPGLSNTLNMTRFYHILLFFLAPLCILGAEILVKLILKRRTELFTSILLVIVLVPYFLFQTNFVYEVVGGPSISLSLSKYRMDKTTQRWGLGYFDDSEVIGALWVSKNVDVKNLQIYADASSAINIFTSYGMMGHQVEVLSNTTVLSANATIYLNRANFVDGISVGSSYFWNTTSISDTLSLANKIYSNGGCEIYQMTINP